MTSLPESDIAFDQNLKDRLGSNLGRHRPALNGDHTRRRAAACLIVLDSDGDVHGHDPVDADDAIDRLNAIPTIGPVPSSEAETGFELTGRIDGTAGGAAVLLTRRASSLSSHARQWAFPGGRIDEGETALEAAMREAAEEVGLELLPDDLLGRLDDYSTRSGYVITPYVFWLGDESEPVANPEEVASIHRIALRELQRQPRFTSIPESDRPVIQVPIGGDLIHAPTGAILHQFQAVAYEGRDLRVDGYEEPVFAWR